jgi:hypothetical protein
MRANGRTGRKISGEAILWSDEIRSGYENEGIERLVFSHPNSLVAAARSFLGLSLLRVLDVAEESAVHSLRKPEGNIASAFDSISVLLVAPVVG